MTSKLSLYNGALLHVTARKTTLTEETEARFVLDDVWDSGAVRACLEGGLWNFAMRGAQIDADPGLEPTDFGYQHGFEKPTDWVRTASVCSDGYFRQALLNYTDEGGIWWADIDPIFVRYVSDLDNYGNDLSLWPQSFARYVEAYLAHRIAMRLTDDDKIQQRCDALMQRLLSAARTTDAMNEPEQRLPAGSWSTARAGRWSTTRSDGGSQTNFTG